MWRYLAGAVAALLLAGGGMLAWRGTAAADPIPPAPAATAASVEEPLADPPALFSPGDRVRFTREG